MSMESFQGLRPTVWIGKQGVTSVMIDEIRRQLKSRKVVKVRWLRNTEVDPVKVADVAGAVLVEVRGRTLVLKERRDGSSGSSPRNI
ncbi:YhbY family RNA-binding protein [Methanoculleus sp.]|jgi:RNA-binding protein|uniref:YhbY family RNA-binding protein n=1 Tax=Methanoculleus sp. TaxID=90427 RepID=UPI002631C715|nr:YhbY family RNA-binding protein [Methanoculleus sp.]MDI6866369.1 YhbY family RNA-binding protein [Methanoculleus sp.]